ncbi:MAG: OmpA family protein [Deltaproteobacteria bacterium]|nr:OmpA family protein [Deltaproteobacteria bacterium]
MSDFELESWFDPNGYYEGKPLKYPEGWLVAQIYFPTNVSTLGNPDKKVLDMLYSVYAPVLLGAKREIFKLVGYADHRHTPQYNLNLGKSRALSVKQYLDNRFHTFRSYASIAESRGERYATKYTQIDVLAGDRRVDVFAPCRIQSSVRLPPQTITGKYAGPLSTRFRFRMLAGGGAGKFIIGAQAFSIEVSNARTNKSAMYTYTGLGPGIGISINRPTGWEEKEVKDVNGNTVWLDVEDFEGPGKVASAGVGASGSIFIFEGPKERGRSKDAVFVGFTGVDIVVGVGVDVKGHWHRR